MDNIKEVSDAADIIVNGYAFTRCVYIKYGVDPPPVRTHRLFYSTVDC
jgi:hypothetical protein